MSDLIKSIGIQLGVYAGLSVLAMAGVRGCNDLLNDRDIVTPAYHATSHATGISGHTEYIKYSDGSRDIKIYSGLGHRLWSSELQQDVDGDGHIERIRENGPEFTMHRLGDVLVRKYDYQEYKKRFDEADTQLTDLIAKYDN